MTFSSPLYFLLLTLIIPYLVWYFFKHRSSEPVMVVSSLNSLHHYPRSFREYLVHFPLLLRIVCFVAAVCALARPQSSNNWEEQNVEGIDIMLCMDVSTSMLAEDLLPNRILAARDVAMEFVNGRPNDNIGLTIFSGESFTQCPMTTDHTVLTDILSKLDCEMSMNGIIEDGTAIGMGLANSISRLKESKAKSKVIIMLTDGANNTGEITPSDAASIAKEFGIRVYTIGVGKQGKVKYPVTMGGWKHYIMIDSDLDETPLVNIAKTTDGMFYRATSKKALSNIYNKIDKLEKTKLQTSKFSTKNEEFIPFLVIALAALLLELLMRQLFLRRLP